MFDAGVKRVGVDASSVGFPNAMAVTKPSRGCGQGEGNEVMGTAGGIDGSIIVRATLDLRCVIFCFPC